MKAGEVVGLSADDYGYIQALETQHQTPSLVAAVSKAIPRATGRTRQALNAWLQRGNE